MEENEYLTKHDFTHALEFREESIHIVSKHAINMTTKCFRKYL